MARRKNWRRRNGGNGATITSCVSPKNDEIIKSSRRNLANPRRPRGGGRVRCACHLRDSASRGEEARLPCAPTPEKACAGILGAARGTSQDRLMSCRAGISPSPVMSHRIPASSPSSIPRRLWVLALVFLCPADIRFAIHQAKPENCRFAPPSPMECDRRLG